MATAEVVTTAEGKASRLLTAEEFLLMPDQGQPIELVRGRQVTMNMPAPRHGYFCGLIVQILGALARQFDCGRVMCNDSGVVTERGPDTVRGADVCFYSYQRLPRGPIPEGYLPVVPEAIFDVRSPTDRWPQIHTKVGEYLDAGVLVVCVHDAQTETLTLFRADQPPMVLGTDEELALPEIHADFRVPVRRFFD
jgi:Uma2 family endonuclease